jgi:glycosyltransferase involved in cell wall biosynthesis
MMTTNPSVNRKPKVLFFGYLAPYKGLETLLQAVAGIGSPDFELLIAGDVSPRARGHPEYEQYLKRIDELIAATKGRARKIGFVPNEEVEALLKSVDLVVFPYTSVLSSSGPLALAMAYGTPLLATRELFEEGALCVYDGTVADLRTKLERFLLHPELRELAAAELVSFRSGRTWSHIAELHREVYLHVGAKT